MIDLTDAVALSLWYTAPRRRITSVLRSLPDCPLEVLVSMIGGRPEDGVRVRALREAAADALDAASRCQIQAVAWGGAGYPPLLADTPDPPVVLWVRGSTATLTRPSIAVVGSRTASPYGLEVAERLACDLAGCGVTIVSGLARGIDSASHRGALAGGGLTVAVLGSGPDVIYPPEHARLACEIAERGAVASELGPGTPPRAFHFPLRNRIISGLSRAVVVVEAAERSGSLITAECALEQGREVMAVPGTVLNGRHAGCHALVRDGATLVESAIDVLAALNGLPEGLTLPATPAAEVDPHPLIAHMSVGEAYDLDQLCALTGETAVALLARLLALELRGAVRRLAGGRFVRSRGSC